MANSSAWNLTVDDSSPLVRYDPYGDGAVGGGWATHYSISGFRQNGGDTPLGDSSHVTWSNQANIAFPFYGSAIYLYGEASCTYDVSLDETRQSLYPPNGTLLASFPNLTLGQHYINVKPYGGGSASAAFWFDKAVITLHSASSHPGKGDIYDNRNSSITYQGTWLQLIDQSIPSTATPAPYHETWFNGSAASLDFYGEAVMIEGPLSWGHWMYCVDLDGSQFKYNGSAWSIIGNTVMYFQAGLDPKRKHTITLINMGFETGLSKIGLNAITVFGSQARGSGGARTIPTSTVVGAAVGGALALLAIVSLAGLRIYLRRRRCDRYPRRGERDPRGIDEPMELYQPPLGYIPEPPTPPIIPAMPAVQQPRRVKGAPPLGRTAAGSMVPRGTQSREAELAGL